MAIVDDEPTVGKTGARLGQWIEITMKMVQRLLTMNDDDEKKHVLDYNKVDLHYVEDQRKNLLSKFNCFKTELSSCTSKLTDLKNTNAHNLTLQPEVTRLNLDNQSLNDEVFDLKKVIEKWTSSKVTLDQLLNEQIHGNIVRALGGRGKIKDSTSSKEVLFTKPEDSPIENSPECASDDEYVCNNPSFTDSTS
nr:hypothetical protein [Tanacetum cinerariifolium]